MNKKKVLITGGAGFIGSAVIRKILTETDYQIINVDKLTYAGNLDSIPKELKLQNYKFYNIDICDKKLINNVYLKHKPCFVIHLAAESHVDRSIEGPSEFINTNIIGTYTLLEESRIYYNDLPSNEKHRFRFLHVSTDEVFGDLKDDGSYFNENTPYSPSSPYSASKASSDHLVRAWGRTYGLPVMISNCSNNYGPYHFPEKLIPHMILNGLSGKPMPVYGDGKQIRDWLYVEDHANALIKILLQGKIGDTYNIGGNNEKTNLFVVQTICKTLEQFVPLKPAGLINYKDLITFVEDRPGHDKRYAIDSSKIQKELNWAPEETFETGIHKTVKWYIQNEKWWKRILNGSYALKRLGIDTKSVK